MKTHKSQQPSHEAAHDKTFPSPELQATQLQAWSRLIGNKALSRMLQPKRQQRMFSSSLLVQRDTGSEVQEVELSLRGAVGTKKAPNYAEDVIAVQNRLNQLVYLSSDHAAAERPADSR